MKISVLLFFVFLSFAAFSQVSQTEGVMQPKSSYNFNSFSPLPTKTITAELLTLTPTEFQTHPEFGIVPYNAQCSNCIELVNKRTANSRYFVKNQSNEKTFFIQQGFGTIHFKDINNNLVTIDPALHPHPLQANVYYAPNQDMPTSYNAGLGSTTIKLKQFELVFNTNPKIYQVTGNLETPVLGNINLVNTTVGQDGALTTNAWPGINRTIIFDRGQIKTNFILLSAPTLPSNDGWIAFEDEIDLPAGYKIIKDNSGATTPEGYWQGDLKLILESSQEELARWSSVIIHDNNNLANVTNAAYQLKNNGNKYFVRAMVKVGWLNNISTIYPVTVDPLVSGTNTFTAGQIGFTPYAPGAGFCGSSSAFCLGGPLNVIFPGAATITNVLWSSKYIAVSPTVMGDGGFRMVGPCGENPLSTNSWWNCAGPPAASGTCSGVNNVVPNLATCLAASCNTTTVTFFTKNIHCNNVVAGACNTARLFFVNNAWMVTVQGQNLSTLTNTTTGNGATTVAAVCLTPVILDPNPMYSVSPYLFLWSPGGQTTSTISFTPNTPGNNTITCQVTDACGIVRTATFVVTNTCTLPIELTEFYLNYSGESCDINWTTASEKNSDYFLLEKSTDAVNYSFLDKVTAAGNSTQIKKYSFRDVNPDKDLITYYRLKLFDKTNSEAKFSLVQTLNPKDKTNQKLNVQPNPASSYLDVYLPASLLNRNVTLHVYDNSGKRVLSAIANKQNLKNAYNLSIESLNNGFYTLQAFDESGNSFKTSFIKN